MNFIKSVNNLTKAEKLLWILSMTVIFVSSVVFPNPDWMSVITSLVGASALIFVGKGDPIGQFICIIFSILYALVSWHLRYFGEMITYMCMSAPASFCALIAWLKNPYTKREVKVSAMTPKKWAVLSLGTVLVTVIMYFVLKYFNTANLIVSTFSVTTSFMASVLTMLRSPYYALVYALNDIVLIVLWVLALFVDIAYLPMVMCFVVFLVNDIYGFVNWRKMKRKQNQVV